MTPIPGICINRGAIGWAFARHCELEVERVQAILKGPHFLEHESQRVPQEIRQGRRTVGEHPGDASREGPRADGHRQALLTEEPPQHVDAGGSRRVPLCAHPVERLQRLLLRCLHRDRMNAPATVGLEERLGVRAVGLVSSYIRAHVLGRQQADGESARLTATAPIVGRATTLHEHGRAWADVVNQPFELPSREGLRWSRRSVRFAQATSNTSFARSTATVVASMSASSWCGCEPRFTAMMPRRNREESIPSLESSRLCVRCYSVAAARGSAPIVRPLPLK
jgi:hypothetical protein